MKNKIEPWENGLSERMKEHEFPFDAEALTGFETLLSAENAVAGKALPNDLPPESASSRFRVGKLLSLLIGGLFLVALMAYALLPGNDALEVTKAPEPSVEQSPATAERSPAMDLTSPAPLPISAPAPAPALASEPVARRTAGTSPDEAAFPPLPQPRNEASRNAAPRPMPTPGYEEPKSSRKKRVRVAALPTFGPILQIDVPVRSLPVVELQPAAAQQF